MAENIKIPIDRSIPPPKKTNPTKTGGIEFRAYDPDPNIPGDVESYEFNVQVLDPDGNVVEVERYDEEVMTAVELAEYIGVRRNRVNATLSHHREYGKSASVFKIASWVWRERVGWIAQYGNGPGIDARKPKPDKQANHQRYREKMKAVARSRNKTFAANPFGELIHMAGATHQVAYWGSK